MLIQQIRPYIIGIIFIGLISTTFHGLGLIKGVPWHIVYSDTLGFYKKISEPGLPYLDKNIEYPVITGWFMQFMSWLGQSRTGYYIFNSLFLVFLAALATYFLYQLTPEQNRKNLWRFWIFAPSMLFFSVYNWDLIAILFTILAFYFTQKEKIGWAAFFLALGFCGKFYPIIYLPLLILKNKKDWLKIIGVFIITVGVLNLPFLLVNFDGWSYFFTLNNLRNSNPDSIWTIARFFFRGLEVKDINLLSLLLFGASYLWLILKNRQKNLIELSFIATLLFLIFNKVFSPQYILWLLPFFVLLPNIKRWQFYTLEFSNLAVFFLILPWHLISQNAAYFFLSAPFVALRHIILLLPLLPLVLHRRS